MGARTLLFLAGIAVAATFLLVVVTANSQFVTVTLPLFLPIRVELWKVMLGGVGIGLVVTLAFDLAGRMRRLLRERRLRRGRQELEEGERLFLEGLGEMASGRWSEALLSFEAAQEYAGADPKTLRRKAKCLMHLGRPAEAAAALGEAAAEDRGDRGVAYALAEALAAKGDPDGARALLEKTIAEDPEAPPSALARLRDLLLEAGKTRAALAAQQQLASVAPPSARDEEERRILALRHAYGKDLLERGEPAEAVRVFRAVLDEDSGAAPAWVRLGDAYLAASNEAAAIETWRKGFAATRATAPLTALQNYYLDRTSPEEAISVWKQALADTDHAPESQYLLGKLYDRLYMLDDALKTFANLPWLRAPALGARLSRILEGRGDLAQAMARAREVMEAAPTLSAEYACSVCGHRQQHWTDDCENCRAYGAVRLDVALDVAAPDTATAETPAALTPPLV